MRRCPSRDTGMAVSSLTEKGDDDITRTYLGIAKKEMNTPENQLWIDSHLSLVHFIVGVGSPTELQDSRTSFIQGVVTVPPNERIFAGASGKTNGEMPSKARKHLHQSMNPSLPVNKRLQTAWWLIFGYLTRTKIFRHIIVSTSIPLSVSFFSLKLGALMLLL